MISVRYSNTSLIQSNDLFTHSPIFKKYANDVEAVKEKEKQEINTIISQRNYERTDEIKLLKALMDKDKVL